MSLPVHLLSALLRALSLLPLSAQRRAGRWIGAGIARFDRRSREVTDKNIQACFPELGREARRALRREALANTGCSIAELGLGYYGSPAQLRRLIRCDSLAVLTAARERGRGVILAAPHFGNWELIGQFLAPEHGIDILYRPARRPALDRWLIARRSRGGAGLQPTTASGVRALARRLREGAIIGILPDQEPGAEGGVFAPFFGHEAWTMTLIAKLAARRQSPVLLSWLAREPGGFSLHFEPLDAAIHDPDPQRACHSLNRAIESLVRRHPTQYTWNYKRFATRPAGEAPFYC